MSSIPTTGKYGLTTTLPELRRRLHITHFKAVFLGSCRLLKQLPRQLATSSTHNGIPDCATYDKIVYDLLRIQAKAHLLQGIIISTDDSDCSLLDTHSRIGHGGERKTFLEIKKKWANVTLVICKICIRYCEDCQLKRKKKISIGLVVKSIVSSSIMSMAQSSEEVAHNLFDVFLLIGAPAILQSDSGRGGKLTSALMPPIQRSPYLLMFSREPQDLHCGDDDSCAEGTTSNGVESDLSKAASKSSRQKMKLFKSDQNKNDNDPNDQRSTTTELGD
ncbi:hypothetical protein T07_12046 [Trichinella nelsoni]|uniref:Integrase zinc-binding domain-containing protein n=1 Tax=Trichinella nelsoni TaxID=6336 RepID=A0A0V0S2C5_9BILA|nr:hypothetical protein T07_12046 [Trichinella nelsoni]